MRAPEPAIGVSPDPGAFSISTAGTPGSIPRTTSSRCGQMTTTTLDRRTTKRSIHEKAPLSARDWLNAKFVSCCGRLECMSYRCGMPSTPAISTPMKLPSSCEWTASYRSANARRRAVTVRVRSSGIFASDGPIRTSCTKGGRRQRNTRRPGSDTSRPNGYVTRSTVWPSSSSAQMRWYSLNGVPRGSKNGSGAIIRIFTIWSLEL